MRRAGTISFCLLAVASTSMAQDVNPYNGTWKVAYDSKKGANREGTVVVSGKGGTWDMLTQRSKNACAGKEVPIAVRTATADELVFEINRSKALMGCKDGLAKLKRVDDNTLEGEFDGKKFTMTRD